MSCSWRRLTLEGGGAVTAASNIRQTAEYRSDTWLIKQVPLFLVLCLAGIALVLYADGKGMAAGWILSIVGVALTGYALYRVRYPSEPILTLAPDALHLR